MREGRRDEIKKGKGKTKETEKRGFGQETMDEENRKDVWQRSEVGIVEMLW